MNRAGNRPARPRAGFTLIELLVVITIIGVLAGIVVVAFEGRTDEAKVAAVDADFASLKSAMNMFRIDHGRWPESFDEMVSGPEHPRTGETTTYLDKVPSDPWSNDPYAFEFDDQGKPYFISYGADMSEGGAGVEQDIVSNEDRRQR